MEKMINLDTSSQWGKMTQVPIMIVKLLSIISVFSYQLKNYSANRVYSFSVRHSFSVIAKQHSVNSKIIYFYT